MIHLLSTWLVFAILPVASTAAVERTAPESTHEKIRKLKVERRDVLKKLVAMQKKLIRAGAATPEILLKYASQLAEAELELAQNEQEIATILKKNYELFGEIERFIEAGVRMGVRTSASLLAIRARRLKAQIRWLSAKSETE